MISVVQICLPVALGLHITHEVNRFQQHDVPVKKIIDHVIPFSQVLLLQAYSIFRFV